MPTRVTVERARQLRKKMTPAERELWKVLRAKRFLNTKFYNQRPIGRFIADFYCARARLVVEVDGGIHALQQEYDKARESWMLQRGILTVRFSNQAVLQQRAQVLEKLAALIQARTSPGPLPTLRVDLS